MYVFSMLFECDLLYQFSSKIFPLAERGRRGSYRRATTANPRHFSTRIQWDYSQVSKFFFDRFLYTVWGLTPVLLWHPYNVINYRQVWECFGSIFDRTCQICTPNNQKVRFLKICLKAWTQPLRAFIQKRCF